MEKKIRPTLIGGQNKLFYLDAETIESIETLAKGRKVSGSQIVREAVKAIKTISSIFKERLGIAYAAIATIKPSTRYLIILLTSSPTFINPFIILNVKKKLLFAIKNLKINKLIN